MKVNGKVLVVTGGGSGIGRALVLDLLSRGASVASVDIRSESLDETSKLADAGEKLVTIVTDVTDRAAVQSLPLRIVEAHGAVDGYISNAGIIQPFVRLWDLDYESIDRLINVNLYGTIHMAKAFVPYLLERPIAHLANLSSMGGFFPYPGQTIYGATKAGVKLLTEGLHTELLETNVGVSVVMPGAVATEISANSGVEFDMSAEDIERRMARTTAPTEAARVIVDGIESDDLHIYIGRDSRMMSLAIKVAPRRSAEFIYRQMKEMLPS